MAAGNMRANANEIGPIEDSPEGRVVSLIEERRIMGFGKYGTTMCRDDLSRLDWLRHAQMEALDLAIYLQKLIDLEIDGPGD